MADDHTFTITADDGSSDELTVPDGLLDYLIEGDPTSAEALGDIAMLALAQHIHGVIHHGHGEGDETLEALEEATLEQFEARFGASFGDVTGHAH